MKFVVTGGAGFIGNSIVNELVSQKHDVIVIDDLSRGDRQRLSSLIESNKIRFVEGNIMDLELLKKEFKGTDFVLHQAALISVPESVQKPEFYKKVGFEGTGNVLEAARINNVKRIVFASSAAVYGNPDLLPIKEDTEPKPLSPYAKFKLEAEKLCKEYYEKHGLKTVVLRYFNVFGPGQDPDTEYAVVIPLFIKKVINNQNPTIFGDGEQTRDFVFIKNIVDANLLAVRTENKDAFGSPINIGSGEETSINQLLMLINKNLGKDIKAVFAPERKGDAKNSCSDITKAGELLGYKNKYSFEQGLRETVEDLKRIY